ncbi:oxygenase MpaB family protein [Mycolicibacterium mucogenicum]|uniref:DUF2236 domain-containing protein n=1 Tax=Mycolicibacterium mucogenicum DSM 44124 TaxID=1226753 RepID=A0A8H2PI94_MYCMU|nr:oxygenase MpaB family protein [Mycolicibacterium mucogenicum]KAB7752760.1 hypothetical protein MMUC44124_26355 [Mycolicibacterium mucogenicum DSM 44124]QPG69067.1 DUF2236 domain-containing protein [Mycolicibacterium mucogenicum DSM 44124]
MTSELDQRSLLWRWAGDMRIAFEGGAAGLLQTMHPAIGYALIEHSNFFDDPVDRVFRSLPGILGTVYHADGAATGVGVRDYHRDIKGEMPGGQPYHALNPRTYWWAHATFQRMVDRVATYWDSYPLTEADSEQLYTEGCIWYRRYGVSDAPLPADRQAFEAEVERYCTQVLEPNPASDYLIAFIKRDAIPDMSASPYFPALPGLNPITDRLLPMRATRMALAPPMRLTIFGGLPEVVRDRFEIRWTRTDERAYRAIRATIRRAWPVVPWSWRWHQEARTGWTRARHTH